MDSGISAVSQGDVVEAPNSTNYRLSLGVEGLEVHPFWQSAKVDRPENLLTYYTDGPGGVVLANDGTKDCLALLLTSTLVAALNQISHFNLALEKRDGALERIEAEITDLERKCDNLQEAIRNPRSQDRVQEMQLALEILQLKQEEAKEHKSKIYSELAPFENRLKFSRYQSQTILEEALQEAHLLDPPELGDISAFDDIDDDTSAGDSFDAPSLYDGVEPTPEQEVLREAHRQVVASYDTLRTCQERFNNRRDDYDQKLAAFEQSGDKIECSRIQFDHLHIQHVSTLTQNLLAAEEGYKTAKAQVKKLQSPTDSFNCAADDGDGDDGRIEEIFAEPFLDRERIEIWRRGVFFSELDVEGVEGGERLDLDGWIAKPVEIMDSLSATDRDDYADEIGEWKVHCAGLREEMAKDC